MNILIRLPNWLGDMVMSTAFVQAVKDYFPDATVDLIAKKGLDFLLDYFPDYGRHYIFSKEEYKGLTGARKFGKLIRKEKKYDLFFCLPDSFSSAIMSHSTRAKERIGYKKELRTVFLTRSYTRKKNIHRVEEYIDLLSQFVKKELPVPPVVLQDSPAERKNSVIININSEAESRRLPKEKAIQLISTLREKINNEIILVGSPKEVDFVADIYAALPDKSNINNQAGKTNLIEMIQLFNSSKLILTTDSGPAHIANALGVFTIVLFGAGNENNTAPYNKNKRQIIRYGQLACEPCVSNTCKLYGVPKCLSNLDNMMIVDTVLKEIN